MVPEQRANPVQHLCNAPDVLGMRRPRLPMPFKSTNVAIEVVGQKCCNIIPQVGCCHEVHGARNPYPTTPKIDCYTHTPTSHHHSYPQAKKRVLTNIYSGARNRDNIGAHPAAATMAQDKLVVEPLAVEPPPPPPPPVGFAPLIGSVYEAISDLSSTTILDL